MVGPNEHDNIIFNTTIPQNALIVNIYGGVCAGTIWEMTQSWYRYYMGNRSVFSVWINTTTNIDNVPFLRRAYDDNTTPVYGSNKTGEFPNAKDINNNGVIEPGPSTYVNNTLVSVNREDGIYYPAEIMKKYGYSYLYQENGDIQTIINAIYNYLMSIS